MGLVFSQTMAQMRNGRFDEDATEKLAEVVRACRETGKKGKLTVTLVVEANGDNGMKIDCRVVPILPQVSSGEALMFDDEDGGLHRQDPGDLFNQRPRAVSAEPTDIEKAINS